MNVKKELGEMKEFAQSRGALAFGLMKGEPRAKKALKKTRRDLFGF